MLAHNAWRASAQHPRFLDTTEFMISTLAKVKASAVCELRVQLGSPRAWLVLAAGIGSVLICYLVLRYAQGPGYVLSITGRLFDAKYFTVTFGHAVLVVFGLGAAFLACDLKSKDRDVGIGETLDAHAVRNHELLLGRILALFALLLCVAGASIAVLLITQQLVYSVGALGGVTRGEVTSPIDALAYLLLDVAPNLLLWLSVISLLAANVTNRATVALLGCALVIAHFWCSQSLPLHLAGLVGGVGPLIPELPSDLVSWTTNHTATALHRVGLLTIAFGFLVASLSLRGRGDEVRLTVKWCCALVLIGIGATSLIGLVHWHVGAQDNVNVWTEYHAKYSAIPQFDLERIGGFIQIEPGAQMAMELHYFLRIPSDSELDEILLSFNPGMEIGSLSISGKPVGDYTFEHGLLRIPFAIDMVLDGQAELRLSATGKPDRWFGYLDDSLELWDSPRNAGLPYIALGNQASVFERSYVALPPQSRWLPMPGSNYGVSDLSSRPQEFFEVDLEIRVPTGWTIGAPGRKEGTSNDSWTSFRVKPRTPIPNFALLAAEFVARTLQIDDLEIELLIHKVHADRLDYAASYVHRLPELIRPVTDRAKEYGLDYPFERFSLVEVPNGLRGYSGAWPFESVLSSPGMMMFREWSLPTAKFERFLDRYAHLGIQQEDQRSLLAMHYFQAYLDSDRFGGSLRNELWRNFLSFQTRPTGKGARALEFVLRQLTQSVFMSYGNIAIYYTSNVFSAPDVEQQSLLNRLTNRSIPVVNTTIGDPMQYLATQYFKGRSAGWEAMEQPLAAIDSHDDLHFSRKVFAMKGLAISSMLFDALGQESAGRFLSALRSRCVGGTYTFEDIEVLAKELELPVLEHLDSWILEPGLPGFTVEGVRLHKKTDGDETESYRVDVAIRNSESLAGVISAQALSVWEQESYWMLFPMGAVEATLVPPNSTVQVSVTTTQEPKYVAIQPYLSYNRSKWEVLLPDPIEADPNWKGDEAKSLSDEMTEDDHRGIVVDDLDQSFSVANDNLQPEGFLFVNLLRPGVMSQPDFDHGLPRYEFLSKEPQIWSRSNLSGAHGRYRRTTAVGIGSATGGWARFDSNLPATGDWKLYYHLPLEPRQAEQYETMYSMYLGEAAARSQPWGKQGTYKLRVLQESSSNDVTFDAALGHMGWNDLGTYSLESGPITVEVSNESNGTFVYADAVKWVPR